jgi:hypothetical protein
MGKGHDGGHGSAAKGSNGQKLSELAKSSEVRGREAAFCRRMESAVNDHLADLDEGIRNTLDTCGREKSGCRCGGAGGGKPKVDLIILIDGSSSMDGAAKAVANAAEAAVKAAAAKCPSDLRVAWFVVDGAKGGANAPGNLVDLTAVLAGTPFKQTHQQYLESIGETGPFEQDQMVGPQAYQGEEGADAIADLCNFYDWRPNACRSIFYISDTGLEGAMLTFDAVAANASAAAVANGVVLFAHKIPPASSPAVEAAYDHMTDPTGGSTYHGPISGPTYVELLTNAICKACVSGCKEAEIPRLEPCVTMKWGNSDCDCFETDDTEIVYISVCNCYSNITFSNVHISYLTVTMPDGSAVPTLPDGTPSVQIVPIGPICFGDIAPCVEGQENCVTRQVVIRTRGARGGRYNIRLYGICYEVKIAGLAQACFVLDLCQD